jgi:hypothetical protein
MQVKVLRFAMHNAASALWYENGRSSVLGRLLYVDMWISRVFCNQYILFFITCVLTLEYFLET